MTELNARQKRHLKALAHALQPVVQVGNKGVTDAVVSVTVKALAAHELVKVKVGKELAIDRKHGAEEFAASTGARLVAVIGRVWVLYRAADENPLIVLPK
jgi:RNA-binding protein